MSRIALLSVLIGVGFISVGLISSSSDLSSGNIETKDLSVRAVSISPKLASEGNAGTFLFDISNLSKVETILSVDAVSCGCMELRVQNRSIELSEPFSVPAHGKATIGVSWNDARSFSGSFILRRTDGRSLPPLEFRAVIYADLATTPDVLVLDNGLVAEFELFYRCRERSTSISPIATGDVFGLVFSKGESTELMGGIFQHCWNVKAHVIGGKRVRGFSWTIGIKVGECQIAIPAYLTSSD